VAEKFDVESFLKSASADELSRWRRSLEEELSRRNVALAPGGAAGAGPVRKVLTFTDGASRGNPGRAGIGMLLFDEGGKKILEDCRFIGEATNNEAEYRALMGALDHAQKFTQDTVECYLDSELVVRQMNGHYAVKSDKMAGFVSEVRSRMMNFRQVTFQHVPREHPRLQLADKLANRGIDEGRA
jgi:ribonuclease HI